MRVTSIRLDETKLNRLDALAETMGQSRGALLNEAVDRYLEYHEWFLTAVDEGIRAADEGHMAPEEDVRAAFAKWGVKIG